MVAHRRLAAESGHQDEAVVRAAYVRMHQKEHGIWLERTQERVRESITFAHDKNFEREAAVNARLFVRDALRRGMGEITYTQIRPHVGSRIAPAEFLPKGTTSVRIEHPHLAMRIFEPAPPEFLR